MKYADLVSAVNDVMAEYDIDLTIRQVYYRLVAAGLIPNTRSAYNGMDKQLVKARESGEVDEDRIADRSRRIVDPSFDSPVAYLDYCQNILRRYYVRRYWDSQPVYCEVWVEKDALSEVLADAVYPLNTIVAPSKGYSSYSYLRDTAHRILHHCANQKPAVILHFRDHDPSGVDMTRDLQKRLPKFGKIREDKEWLAHPGNIEVRRVALTFDQAQQYNLIPNPVKMADPRANGYVSKYGAQCWELDAIPPDELVRLCREAVEGMITDKAAWLVIKEQDQVDRRLLLDAMESLDSWGDQAA